MEKEILVKLNNLAIMAHLHTKTPCLSRYFPLH